MLIKMEINKKHTDGNNLNAGRNSGEPELMLKQENFLQQTLTLNIKRLLTKKAITNQEATGLA